MHVDGEAFWHNKKKQTEETVRCSQSGPAERDEAPLFVSLLCSSCILCVSCRESFYRVYSCPRLPPSLPVSFSPSASLSPLPLSLNTQVTVSSNVITLGTSRRYETVVSLSLPFPQAITFCTLAALFKYKPDTETQEEEEEEKVEVENAMKRNLLRHESLTAQGLSEE